MPDTCYRIWWATRESNPDGLPHTPLKRARLPVPPAARLSRLILPRGRGIRHRQQGGDGRPVSRSPVEPQVLARELFEQRRATDAVRVPRIDLAIADGEFLVRTSSGAHPLDEIVTDRG